MTGLHMHIGSQITSAEPYAHAAARAAELIGRLREMGHDIRWCNMGGGFGIDYRGGEARPIAAFAEVMVPALKRTRAAGWRWSRGGRSPATRASWSAG